MADNEWKLEVGVKINEKNLKEQLKGIKLDPITIDIDTKEATKKIDELKKKIESVFKIKIDANGSSGSSNASKQSQKTIERFEKLLDLQGKINSLQNRMGNLTGVDLTKAQAELQEYMVTYDKLYKTVAKKLNTDQINQLNKAASASVSSVKQTTNAWKELNRVTKEVGNISTKLAKLNANPDVNINQIRELEKQLEDAKIASEELRASLRGQLSSDQYQKLNTELANTEKKIRQTEAAIADTKAKLSSNIINNGIGNYDKQYDQLNAKFKKIQTQSADAKSAVKSFYDALDNLKTVASTTDASADQIIDAYNQVVSAANKANNAVTKNKIKDDSVMAEQQLSNRRTSLSSTMDVWLDKNSAAKVTDIGKRIRQLQVELKSCDAVRLNNIQAEFAELKKQAQLTGVATMSLSDRLKMQFQRYSAYFSIATVMFEATRAAKEMYQAVLEVDTAMTELKRVTDLTTDGYDKLYDKMIGTAKEYGAALSDIISATADWSRAGFDAETANGLAGITTMYQHIADLDYDEAVQNLLTTYKGFEKELTSSEMFGDDTVAAVGYVADILNELDNNYSVTAAGVGEALKRSAASLDVAGNSIQETAAMVTGIVEVTQDPEKAGNALKVVSMRLRGMKGELEDIGEETDENVENISKMQGQILKLTNGKVNIFDNNGEFKSTYEIMQGIAEVWDDLNSTAQADLLETVAGKHRANDVASLLSNWQHVEDAVVSANEATGSASKENEKFMNSMQGHLNSLTTAWQTFSNTVLESNFLKGLIDIGTNVLNVFEGIINAIGDIPSLIGLIAGALSFKNIGLFKTIEDQSAKSGKRIQSNIKNAFDFVTKPGTFDNGFLKGLNADRDALKQYAAELRNGTSRTEAFKKTMASAGPEAQALAKSMTQADSYGKNFSKVLSKFTTEQKQSVIAMQAQNKSLSSCKSLIAGYNDSMNKAGLSQKQYAQAVSQSNPVLGKYLSGLNGAKASLKGFAVSAIGAKVATLALNAAMMALNMIGTMVIGTIVSGIISAIDEWIVTSEELAEKVDEVTNKYKEQQDTLKNAKSLVDEVAPSDGSASRYQELAKGVNELGQNVSLTSDEYEEYQGIVSEIASMFPELVSGYDAQGNAILSCKDNVELLTQAYKEMAIAANNELLKSADDISKDVLNDLGNLNENTEDYGDIPVEYNEYGGTFSEAVSSNSQRMKALKNVLESGDLKSALDKYVQENSGVEQAIVKTLEHEGLKREEGQSNRDFILSSLQDQNSKAKIQSVVNSYYNELEEAISPLRDIVSAHLNNAFLEGTTQLDDSTQGLVSQIAEGISAEKLKSLNHQGGADAVTEYVDTILADFEKLKEAGDLGTIEAGFDLKTEFNDGDLTFGEYKNQLDEVVDFIDNSSLDEEVKSQLKLSLNVDEVQKQYDDLVSSLKAGGIDEDVAKDLVDSLSSSELQAAIDIAATGEVDFSGMDVEDIRSVIEEKAKLDEALKFTVDIDVETEKLDNLNTAVSESLSGTGLGTESITAVESMFSELNSYDPSKLFERTANGIRLNTSELKNMNDEYKATNLNGLDNKLSALGDQYNQTKEELYGLTYGTDEYNKKASELNDIEAQINATEQLAAQYEGLTSAYNEWQMAESAGTQRDMYESVISGLENVGDELSRGWVDDATIEFLELMTGEDLGGANVDKLKSAWKSLDKTIKGTSYSVKDFFTTNDDGESTSTGVFNFLEAVDQKFDNKDIIKRDKNNEIVGFDFQVVGGDEAIADALGISEELVQIMVRAADDAGFVISMDGTYQQLEVLKEKAQTAAETLNQIFEKHGVAKVDFDFNADTIKEVKPQLENAKAILDEFRNEDGTIDMSVEGAEEAYTVASTLQSMLDELEEPTYMDLEVSQVEDEMQEPLSQLQEYERLTQTEHQLKLKGTDTSEVEKSKEEIIDYFDELQESNPEIAAELEIDGLSREEIEKKVDSGEIKIPATIDIQMEMDDKLGILVDKALLDAGIIDEEEFEKRVSVYVDADVNTDETKDDIDKKIDEALGEETELSEDQKVTIKAFAEVFGTGDLDELNTKLDSLSDKQIKILADVLGKVDVDQLKTAIGDLDDKSVQAIAEALGKGDVDGLKTAIDNIPNQKTAKAIAQAFGYSDVEELKSAIGGLKGKDVKAIAQALGITDVDSLRGAVNRLTDKNVKATVDTAGQADKVKSLQSTIDGLKGTTVTIWAQIKKKASELWGKITGGGDVDGTAHASGSAFVSGTTGKAFSKGDWGTKDSGVALGGELGQELIVRDGRWFTIGDNGAEFFKYKKNDIIFNAGQTKQLFEQGKIVNGRTRGMIANANGTAFAEGTAFASGKAFAVRGSTGSGGGLKSNTISSSSSSKSSKKKSSSSSSSDKDFEETFDWIEIKIDRIERAISRLDKTFNNTFIGWKNRTNALNDELSQTREEINLQNKAYNSYIKQANKAGKGLDKKWKRKVESGQIGKDDIANITDKDLAEKIKNYKEWYDKAIDCKKAIDDLKESERELVKQQFDFIGKMRDYQIGIIDYRKSLIDEKVAQQEAQGHVVSTKYYDALKSYQEQENKKNASIAADKQKQLEENVRLYKKTKGKKGIKVGSEEWYREVEAINELNLSVEQGKTKILEYEKTIRELKWENMDRLHDKISRITDESEFLIELMSNDKLYDDKGQFTDKGQATAGLRVVNYQTYMEQAKKYAENIKELNAQLAADPKNEDADKKRYEYIEAQREAILAAEKEKDAIKDLVEEGINKELDSLQKLIDKKQESLESEKSLYDYQKKVKDQTKEIAALEKQMAAYAGDNSEEAKAKIQELKVSLEDAKADLEETEYDKYVSDQKEMLDNLYDEYEEILNKRLDDVDALLKDMIAATNENKDTIKQTLEAEASGVSTTLSESMGTIWTSASGVISGVGTAVDTLAKNLKDMFSNPNNGLDVNAANEVKKVESASAGDTDAAQGKEEPKKTEQPKNTKQPATTPAPSSTGGDGKAKVGDKVTFSSGKYHAASDGSGATGNAYLNKSVYITKIKSGAKYPYLIGTKKGNVNDSLGWVKLSQINGYATGKRNLLSDEFALTQENGAEMIVRPSDGAILTPLARGDSVLNAAASGNIWDMANNPADFIKNNLGIDAVTPNASSNAGGNYSQNIENVSFVLPNVKNYDQMLAAMQKDKNFERLINAMTIDQVAGKSKLGKGKAIR